MNSGCTKGTTFTIFLPSLGELYTKFQSGIAAQATCDHKGGAILVMDDEEMIRDIAATMLTYLGYEVTTCASGDKAVELYKTSMESGILFLTVNMDLTIPGGIGGKEAVETDSLSFSQGLFDCIKRILERPNYVQLPGIRFQRGDCQTLQHT